MRISDRIVVESHQDLIDIGGTDIHNGVATANWIDMALFDSLLFYVSVGPTWNAADQLDDLHINQASDATGTGTKALAPNAKNLDQTAANTAGEDFILECKAADLDTEGGFHWVRLECAEAGNTGTDQVVVTLLKVNGRFQYDDMSAVTDNV